MVAKTKPAERRHTDATRTTLSLDNDVLLLIRQRAETTGESMGKAASDLIRESQRHREDRDSKDLPPYVIPRRKGSPPVTMELVNRLRDELQ